MSSKGFFYLAHCEGDTPSSKRIYGGIGFAACQIAIIAATIISLCKTGELHSAVVGLLDFDLVTSASLLGLSSITRAFGGNTTTASNNK